MKKFCSDLYQWLNFTSRPLGWVYLTFLIITWTPVIAEKTFFSATCAITSWKCQYSWNPLQDKRAGVQAISKMFDDPEFDEPTITPDGSVILKPKPNLTPSTKGR